MKQITNSQLLALKFLKNNKHILDMHKYRQHGETDTYQHSCNVAVIALKIAMFFNIKDDKIMNIIKGSMLHDFYLYDYHGHRNTSEGFHAFVHSKIALRNAQKYFNINKRQQNIIISHMFPATIFYVPKYIESWIVNISDKYCTIREVLHHCIYKKQWEAVL